MGNWTPSVELEPISFDGDQIVLTVKRLVTEQMHLLSSFTEIKGEEVTITFDDSMELMSRMGQIIPDVVVGVRGMTFGDGANVSLEDFLRVVPGEFYFMDLISDLLVHLINVSTVKKEDEENSDGPLQESLET